MKRTITLLLGMALVPVVAHAGDEQAKPTNEALEILKKVDEAAKAVKVVQYNVKLEQTGEVKRNSLEIEGTYLLSGWTGNGPEKFLIDVKARQGPYYVKDLTVGSDGKVFYVIDHGKQRVTEGKKRSVLTRFRREYEPALMGEFLHPTPFSDEINGKSQELKGSKEIGGEDCHEIHVVYDTGGPQESKAIWYVSKKDLLPRARHDVSKTWSGKEQGQLKTITNLIVDPKLDKDAFKMKVPEGYQTTEDSKP